MFGGEVRADQESGKPDRQREMALVGKEAVDVSQESGKQDRE